jgi:hypothetical protein
MKLRSIGTAATLSLVATGLSAALAVPAFADGPSVSANPSTGLKDGQTTTVSVTGFTDSETSGTALAAECSSKALQYQSDPQTALGYCDTGNAQTIPIGSDGSGSGPFTVAAGSSYSDSMSGKCDATHGCEIAVADGLDFQQFAFTKITFAKVAKPVATKTSVSAKSGKAGSKIKVNATTKASKKNGTLSGKVTFTDNGKKVAKVNETKSGKVNTKIKLVKGKNKIVATYSGNKDYKKSSGSKTVTGKKK